MIHQTTELWLKVMVHELRAARRMIACDSLGSSFKMLARVSRIQAQLIQSWDVLSTLTPADYLVFRDRLGPASGLQSHQYRVLECLLGNKRPGMLAVFRHDPEIQAELAAELGAPSLYDEAIRLLARAACRSRRTRRSATGGSPIGPMPAFAPPGRRSIATPPRTGISTSSPRS